MYNKELIVFIGEIGIKYNFTIYPKDTSFYNVSAVYIFTNRHLDGNTYIHTPLYIGESGQLGSRIAKHEKWPCVTKHGCTHICIMQINGEDARIRVETDLIHNYDPVCNKQ